MHGGYFWWGSDVGVFLFPGYEIRSVGALVATNFGLASLAFLFEWLKLLQARHRQQVLLIRSKQIRSICPSESSTLLDDPGASRNVSHLSLVHRSLIYAWEGFLCLSLQNLGYLLMLAVMLYNAWFLIAVVCGGGLGYFLFGQIFMKINLRNCQIMKETFCALKCEEQGNSSMDGESTPALRHSPSCADNSCHDSQTTVYVHTQHNS